MEVYGWKNRVCMFFLKLAMLDWSPETSPKSEIKSSINVGKTMP